MRELRGEYANYLEVGHNAFEFVFDFGQSYESDEGPQVHSRIVTNPACAKAFYRTLEVALTTFESEHGVIEESAPPREDHAKR